MSKKIALNVKVVGIVQGVGFRPFVYRLASKLNLGGYVKNLGGSEVEIQVEGSEELVNQFLSKLLSEKPPPALIENIEVREVKPEGYSSFTILESGKARSRVSMIPPDIGVCESCLGEVLSETRWRNYPFNSCAWCGPRFSMMYSPPYDRERTAMSEFPMCELCLSEYRDPANLRRFHAQGISCPICGPRVFLTDRGGIKIEVDDPIAEAARLIDEGYIVAVKGIGGFHLAALASSDDVVLELRRRKGREEKPFALMALDLSIAEEIAEVNQVHRELLTSPEKPIVLIPMREGAAVSKFVAPGLNTIGIELAYTPLHYLLLSKTRDKYLIMTSGNYSGEPMCTSNEEALRKLSKIADYFLMHNRKIVNRVDDSVIRLTCNKPVFIRRSRGYAPSWFKLPIELKRPIIAFGAMLQSTAAIALEQYAIPTQFIGDVEDYETLSFLEGALNFLIKGYGVNIKNSILACDLHPSYLSTRLAEEWSKTHEVPLIKVQHHHAHIASAMASFNLPLDEEVIGIAMDGVGYGVDGCVWGGEVLRASYSSFERVGMLEYHVMPGGDAATNYPFRMLMSILSKSLSEQELIELATRYQHALPRGVQEAYVVLKQIRQGTPKTSSTGRVLDAISALLNVCFYRSYEGEPAMKLEAFSKLDDRVSLKMSIKQVDEIYVVDTASLVKDAYELLMEGYDPKAIGGAFQYAIGKALGEIAVKVAKRNNRYVVVSGGAAVNDFIVKGIYDALQNSTREVLLPSKIPVNDGGISLGQVMVALANSELNK